MTNPISKESDLPFIERSPGGKELDSQFAHPTLLRTPTQRTGGQVLRNGMVGMRESAPFVPKATFRKEDPRDLGVALILRTFRRSPVEVLRCCVVEIPIVQRHAAPWHFTMTT